VRHQRVLIPAFALLLVMLSAVTASAQGDEVPRGPGFGARALQALIDGIQFGVIIAITAVGLSLIFGTIHLINFAHGELVTIGATFAFFLNVSPAGPGWHLILAAIAAVAFGALLGAGIDRGLWRPLRARGTGLINMFIVTIGLSLLLRHIVLVMYGTRPGSYAQYDIQKAIDLGPAGITPRDLTVTLLSVLTLLGVAALLQRTRVGTAIRAVSESRDLAEASGINVQRVVSVVWMLGGALAALGGVFFGLVEIVTWDMGFKLLLLMFAGVILGGLGSAYGAMVGSLVIGIVAQMSTLWFPVDLQYAWALLTLIIVLLVRPQGILGRRERIG
jgi:neutral amino acid transport system permease protein